MTPRRLKHHIAEKIRFREKWEADKPAMLKRCSAGGKATASKAKEKRDVLVRWLSTMPPRMTKAEIIKEFELRMVGGRDVKARSLVEKMRLYGKIRYDEESGLWLNVDKCQQAIR
jgi:hypothetical protein